MKTSYENEFTSNSLPYGELPMNDAEYRRIAEEARRAAFAHLARSKFVRTDVESKPVKVRCNYFQRLWQAFLSLWKE